MAEAKKPTRARAPSASALKSAAPATPAYVSKYTVGDQISHPMFGDGIVTAIHTDKLTIEFPHSGITQIVDDFVTHREL